MFLSASGSAKMAAEIAKRKQLQEQRVRAKAHQSSIKYQRKSSDTLSTACSVSETLTEDTAQSSCRSKAPLVELPASSSSSKPILDPPPARSLGRKPRKGAESVWSPQNFQRVTGDELRQVAAIAHVEGVLKQQHQKQKLCQEQLETAQTLLNIRLSSRNATVVLLAVNTCRRAEAAKMTVDRTIEQLQNLLTKIVEGETQGTVKHAKDAVEEILEAAPFKPDCLPLNVSMDTKLLMQEVRITSVSC